MDIPSRKLQHLLEANRILSSTLNLSQLLRQIMRLATDVVEAETSSLLLYDEGTDELVFHIALSDKESELKGMRLKLGEGIAGWIAKEKKTQIINDVARDTRWASRADERTQYKTRSMIGVPLLYKDRLLGVVEALNKKGDGFTEEDAQILEAFAAQASVALENARIFESLQEEKEKIETVFSQMSDGVLLVDRAGRKLMANKSAGRLLGEEYVSRGTLQGIMESFTSVPDLMETLSSEDRFVQIEFARKEGKALYFEGALSKIVTQPGDVLGCVLVFRDITAEKKESLVKRNFLSLISHKLKTPLVSIIGFAPLLLEDKSISDLQRKGLKSIQRQGTYLSSLVEKLLYFTMLESDELKLVRNKSGLAEIVTRALSPLKSYAEEKNARIAVSDDIKDLPLLDVDSEKVETAIRNLVENAIKFNSKAEKTVAINLCRDAERGYSGFSVTDNGPGIPPEERDRIFQKFYQIEESFTGQVEGAGLGLTLIKQIVEAHGGIVTLESRVGAGSTFKVLFPVGN